MTPPAAPASNLPPAAVYFLASVYFVTAIVLFYLLVVVWPAGPDTATLKLFDWALPVDAQVRLMGLVVIASALGSYTHTATSFALFAGNRSLSPSWLAWYLLRPAISAALALIFYFTLRAGLFAGSASDQSVNPFGIAALSGMVGMFSKQATAKLSRVFDTIFS